MIFGDAELLCSDMFRILLFIFYGEAEEIKTRLNLFKQRFVDPMALDPFTRTVAQYSMVIILIPD